MQLQKLGRFSFRQGSECTCVLVFLGLRTLKSTLRMDLTLNSLRLQFARLNSWSGPFLRHEILALHRLVSRLGKCVGKQVPRFSS